MKLYFKDLECYQNLTDENKTSDFYKPDYYFDLALLPSKSLMDELAPFIIFRGQTLTFKSLYIERRNFMLSAEFISENYSTLQSFLDIDLHEFDESMKKWLQLRGINPVKKQGSNNILHPSITYIHIASSYIKPKMRIFFWDLKCYKDVPKDKQCGPHYSPGSSFDLELLPPKLVSEVSKYIFHRGEVLSFTSMETERTAYSTVAVFLSKYYPKLDTLCNMDEDACVKKLKVFLLGKGSPITRTTNKGVQNHPSIQYLKRLIRFFIEDDEKFHFEDDLWELDRIDFEIKNSLTSPKKSLNFSNIANETMKKEVKKTCLYRLRIVTVATVAADIMAINSFTRFLEKEYPQIQSLIEIDREIIESYLLYLNTEDSRKGNYRTELMHLKSHLEAMGMVLDEYSLSKLFLPDDFPRKASSVYRFYTDNELKRLNEGFKTLDPQTGRLMILHEILGCRISETLTLKTDCIRTDDNENMYIYIYQNKVNRGYQKPINADIKRLIDACIAYTNERYGDTEFIFVNESNPSMPLSYGILTDRLKRMIQKNDLRDDHGELFTASTHIFRKTCGRRLCDMGIDDSVIAKLLGHSGTSSVKHYRKMTNSVLADGTKQIRDSKDEMIKKYKGGWN